MCRRLHCTLDAFAAILVGQEAKEVITVGIQMADSGNTIILSIACNGTVRKQKKKKKKKKKKKPLTTFTTYGPN